MADIDFITDLTGGDFKISFTNNPQKISGNRALLNRFEIVFLTKAKAYVLDDGAIYNDNFGGNGDAIIVNSGSTHDINGIIANIIVCIEKTVKSMQSDQDFVPDTEKISGAKLLNIYIQSDIIYATIEVIPVEIESYESLITNLPVIKR